MTWLTVIAMFGGLAIAQGFHRPEGVAVADAGLALVRGLSPGSGTKNHDVCATKNLKEGDSNEGTQITAAQCVDSTGSGRPCVSCGTGQVVIDPNSAGKHSEWKELGCRNFQKLVGICWRSPPDFIYSCRDLQVLPNDKLCAGEYQQLLEQREPEPPGGGTIPDSLSP